MVEKATIVNRNSGVARVCKVEGYPGGKDAPWVQLRFPNFSGCYNFSLSTGWIEHKRGHLPDWYMLDTDLEKLREEARAEGKVFTSYPRNLPALKPRKPRRGGPLHKRQGSLFGD